MATRLFGIAVETLGIGVGSAVNLLDVDRVIIGGGLAEKLGQDLADRLAEATAPWMLQPSPDLAFVAASLDDDSGVVGAASISRAMLISG